MKTRLTLEQSLNLMVRGVKALVPVLNKTVSKGHTWQCDDNGNIYILRGPFIVIKL